MMYDPAASCCSPASRAVRDGPFRDDEEDDEQAEKAGRPPLLVAA